MTTPVQNRTTGESFWADRAAEQWLWSGRLWWISTALAGAAVVRGMTAGINAGAAEFLFQLLLGFAAVFLGLGWLARYRSVESAREARAEQGCQQ